MGLLRAGKKYSNLMVTDTRVCVPEKTLGVVFLLCWLHPDVDTNLAASNSKLTFCRLSNACEKMQLKSQGGETQQSVPRPAGNTVPTSKARG